MDDDEVEKCKDQCLDKMDDEMDKCRNQCFDKRDDGFDKCVQGADGRYKLKIKNNYIGDDGNKYDESSKKGSIDFNDPRLISAVASICRGESSYVEIDFKEGVIGN